MHTLTRPELLLVALKARLLLAAFDRGESIPALPIPPGYSTRDALVLLAAAAEKAANGGAL